MRNGIAFCFLTSLLFVDAKLWVPSWFSGSGESTTVSNVDMIGNSSNETELPAMASSFKLPTIFKSDASNSLQDVPAVEESTSTEFRMVTENLTHLHEFQEMRSEINMSNAADHKNESDLYAREVSDTESSLPDGSHQSTASEPQPASEGAASSTTEAVAKSDSKTMAEMVFSAASDEKTEAVVSSAETRTVEVSTAPSTTGHTSVSTTNELSSTAAMEPSTSSSHTKEEKRTTAKITEASTQVVDSRFSGPQSVANNRPVDTFENSNIYFVKGSSTPETSSNDAEDGTTTRVTNQTTSTGKNSKRPSSIHVDITQNSSSQTCILNALLFTLIFLIVSLQF